VALCRFPKWLWGFAARRSSVVAAWFRGKLESAEPVTPLNKLARYRAPRLSFLDLQGGEEGGVEEEILAAIWSTSLGCRASVWPGGGSTTGMQGCGRRR
jgi:hypothetical protein